MTSAAHDPVLGSRLAATSQNRTWGSPAPLVP